MQPFNQERDLDRETFSDFCKIFDDAIDAPNANARIRRFASRSVSQTWCTFSLQATHSTSAFNKVAKLAYALSHATKEKLPAITEEEKLSPLELRSIKRMHDLSYLTDQLKELADKVQIPLPDNLQTVCEYIRLARQTQLLLADGIQALCKEEIQSGDLLFVDEMQVAKHKAKQPPTLWNLLKKVCNFNFEDFASAFHFQPYVTGPITHVGTFNHVKDLRIAQITEGYGNVLPNLQTMSYSHLYRLDFKKLLTKEGFELLGAKDNEEASCLAHKRFTKIIDSILSEENETLQKVKNCSVRARNSVLPTWCDKRRNIPRRQVKILAKSMHCAEFTARLLTKALIRFENELNQDKAAQKPLIVLPIPDSVKFKNIHPGKLLDYFRPYLQKLAAPSPLNFFCQKEAFQP